MNFDLNLIRPFLAAYRYKSYTRAAEMLNMSQPAVSRAIKRLEQVLGEPLFVKSGRGVEATLAADLFANSMTSVENLICDALSRRESAKIYCHEAMLFRFPELNLELVTPPSEQARVLEDIRLAKVDLALDYITEKHPSIIIEELGQIKMVIAAAQHNPIQYLDETRFYQAPHVLYKSHRHGITIFDLLAENPQKRIEKLVVPSIMTMLTYVSRDSSALCLVPEVLAKDWQKQLNIKLFDCPVKLSPPAIQMIYLRKHEHSARHRQLREQIKRLVFAEP